MDACPTQGATAQELDGFEWSGYYCGVLLPYLDEKGVSLMDSEFDEAASALLTALHRHIGGLDDSSVLLLTVG